MKAKNVKYCMRAFLLGATVTLAGCGNKNIELVTTDGIPLEETMMSREEKFKDREVVIVEDFMGDGEANKVETIDKTTSDKTSGMEEDDNKQYYGYDVNVIGFYDPSKESKVYSVMENTDYMSYKPILSKEEFVDLFGETAEKYYDGATISASVFKSHGIFEDSYCSIENYYFSTPDYLAKGSIQSCNMYIRGTFAQNKIVTVYDASKKPVSTCEGSISSIQDGTFYNNDPSNLVFLPLCRFLDCDYDTVFSKEELQSAQNTLDETGISDDEYKEYSYGKK